MVSTELKHYVQQLLGKRIQDSDCILDGVSEQNIYDLHYIGTYVATLEPLIIFTCPNIDETVQVRPLRAFFKEKFAILESPARPIEPVDEKYEDTNNNRKYSLIANGHLLATSNMHVYVSIYRDLSLHPSNPVLVRNWNIFNDGRNSLLRE
jgi:hypothetical protein